MEWEFLRKGEITFKDLVCVNSFLSPFKNLLKWFIMKKKKNHVTFEAKIFIFVVLRIYSLYCNLKEYARNFFISKCSSSTLLFFPRNNRNEKAIYALSKISGTKLKEKNIFLERILRAFPWCLYHLVNNAMIIPPLGADLNWSHPNSNLCLT